MSALGSEVLVIGAGPGGYVAAIRLAQLGKQVIVAEQARVGGVCLNWGCIPTKALLHAAHTLRLAREGSQFGLKFAEPEKDIAQLSTWRNRIVDRLVRGIEYLFRQNRIGTIPAQAEFADEHQVRLNHPNGDVTLVNAPQIIIATGSEATPLPGFEPDGERIITSNEAVLVRSVPPRLLIIGAGAIGLEFASIYAALGSQVIVVEVMDQILPGSDPELAGVLERSLRKQGIEIRLKSKVASADQGRDLTVNGESVQADQILVAVGRKPLTRNLGLENTGVKLNPKGFIEVNEFLETTQPSVWAIGDVARPPLLAHKASREGIVVAERIAGNQASIDLRAVPNCVFTDPELATVGLTEAEALAAGYEVAVGRMPLSALGRAATLNRLEGMCKIVADARTDKVLGVHILAPEASSLIGEAVLAVEHGLTAQQIASSVHPHPTLGELMMEAAEAVHHRAIHIPKS